MLRRAGVALAILQVACASGPARRPYDVPAEIPSAPLTVTARLDDSHLFSAGDIEVMAFEPVNCVASPWGLHVATLSPDGEPAAPTRDVRVAIGQSIVLTASQHTRNSLYRSDCSKSVQFRPEPGYAYLLEYGVSEGWCGLSIRRRPEQEPAADAEWKADPTEQWTPKCIDAGTKQRLITDYPDTY